VVKENLKYYLLSVLGGLLFFSLFILPPQTSQTGDDPDTISDAQQINYTSSSCTYIGSVETVSSIKHKFVAQRHQTQNKLKVTGRINAKFLSSNFSNSYCKEFSQSRQLDKSNHCCFLI